MNLFADHPPAETGPYPAHLTSPAIRGSIARVDDPDTSYEAAAHHQHAGKLHAHAAIVNRLLRKHPGRTSVELFDLQRDYPILDRHEVSRRLDTLKKQGLARKSPKRNCSIKGTPMITWFPITARTSPGGES